MTNTNRIAITTPAGRTIMFTQAAAENISETGMSGQIDTDVDALKGGGSVAALLGICQDGADDDRLPGWGDYVDAIEHTADNEMLREQAANG